MKLEVVLNNFEVVMSYLLEKTTVMGGWLGKVGIRLTSALV